MKKSLFLVLAIAAGASSINGGIQNMIPGLTSAQKDLVAKAKEKVLAKYEEVKGIAADSLKDVPGAFDKFKNKIKSLNAGEKVQMAAGYLEQAAKGQIDTADELINSFAIDK